MSELGTAMIAQIDETAGKMVDFDQRSALGMARSWLDNGTLDTWNPERHKDMIQYPKRDALAQSLVDLMVEQEREDCLEALQAARKHVNEPFLDPTMLGQQDRNPTLKPGERKKQREKDAK